MIERTDETRLRGVDAVKVSSVAAATGYEVTVYRTFAAAELAGLPTSDQEAGRVWISATDRDLTSIYFLAANGVGLRVAHLSPDAPAPVEALTSIATVLASDPTIVEEAGR